MAKRGREKGLAEVLSVLAEHREELRARFGVRRLGIFGSRARGEATPASDLDVLVELERPLGWEIVDLHRRLEEITGLRVDLVTLGALRRKPHLLRAVEEDLVYV